MRTLINFFGLPRSGNHAVINWIVGQYQDNGYNTIFENNKDFTFYNNIKLYLPNNPNHEYINEKTLLLVSFENKAFLDFPKLNNQILSCFQKRINVVLLRDPFNFFASRMKHRTIKHHYKDKIVGFYRMYAYEYLGRTNYLDRKVVINYNSWNSDVGYREKVADALGVPFTDKMFNTLAVKGLSSFDSNFSPDFHDKVQNRWKEMVNDQEYKDLFRGDEELFQLSNEIFGEIPGTEVLL